MAETGKYFIGPLHIYVIYYYYSFELKVFTIFFLPLWKLQVENTAIAAACIYCLSDDCSTPIPFISGLFHIQLVNCCCMCFVTKCSINDL